MFPIDFDFELGSRVDELRQAVREFALRKHRAGGRRDRPQQPLSARALARARRHGPARHDGARGVRRPRLRLPRAHRRHGGDQPRLRLHRSLLRRPLEPLRQPVASLRHRRPEAPFPPAPRLRRGRRRARDERARLGLGRGLDAHASRTPRRRLRAQRFQDVDHERPRGGHGGHLRDARARERRARHHRVHRRAQDEGLALRAETRQVRHARLGHFGTRIRGLLRAGWQRAGPARRRRGDPDVGTRLRTAGADRGPARPHARRARPHRALPARSRSSSGGRSAASS